MKKNLLLFLLLIIPAISLLSNGVYFVRIITDKGASVSKFVKN